MMCQTLIFGTMHAQKRSRSLAELLGSAYAAEAHRRGVDVPTSTQRSGQEV